MNLDFTISSAHFQNINFHEPCKFSGSPNEKEEAKRKLEEEIEKKPTLKPDTCKSSVDAITMHDDKFYVFKVRDYCNLIRIALLEKFLNSKSMFLTI